MLWIAGLMLLLFAWTNTSLAADRIGFINMQTIIQNSNAGKKAAEDFKSFLPESRKASRPWKTKSRNSRTNWTSRAP